MTVKHVLGVVYTVWALLCLYLSYEIDRVLYWFMHFLYDYFFFPEGSLRFLRIMAANADNQAGGIWWVLFLSGAAFSLTLFKRSIKASASD